IAVAVISAGESGDFSVNFTFPCLSNSFVVLFFFTKVFNDPIHGHMALHPVLVKIIDTPEFQRLRNIRQLGGIYNVYPGASHNRFEHSIGYLMKFKPNELEKMKKSLISDRDVLCVEIAGLCHDLDGHHRHEDASIEMFNHLLENTDGLKDMMREYGMKIEGDDKTDLEFIEELIRGPPKVSWWSYKGRKEEKSFLYEIVSNKETGIDVDKFDYVARDCQQLGIPNSFDHQRFIMLARVCDVEEDGRKHVCSRDKEIENLYDIFHTRLSIHRRACKHKIKMAVEMMIRDAFLLVDDHPDFKIKSSKGEWLSLSEAKGDMEAYIKLTGSVFNLWEEEKNLKKATKILQRVMKRDLYRCVGQARVCSFYVPVLKVHISITRITIINISQSSKKAYFYRKNNPDKGELIPKSKVSKLLLDCFSDDMFRVYWKNNETLQGEEREEKEKKVKEFFKRWCKDNNLEVLLYSILLR
uniref:HD/PDEase domain-containing protein n=1 Tax=Pundamilia nyererei TaxID=303518 RepID=A0A3B4HBT8_9CICH